MWNEIAKGPLLQLADEYEKQYQRLKSFEVLLDLYDREELSILLKNEPELVHDFFGKSWVKLFNGEKALNLFTNRLEPIDLGVLRKKLHTFYSAVFDQEDVIIPLPAARPGVDKIPLHERFVFPDPGSGPGRLGCDKALQ